MTPRFKKTLTLSAIAFAATALTVGLSELRFFEQLKLKAQDLHFVLRGSMPVRNIVILGVDDETEANPDFLTPSLFWHDHYADAITAAARAGARVFVLDEAFAIPVEPYEKDPHPHLDSDLAAAFAANNPVMPIVCAFVPEAMGAQREGGGAVPLNMIAGAMGMSAYANLTTDSDDFVRTQVLIEAPKAGVPDEALTRGMALRAAEKFLGTDAHFKDGKLYLGNRLIPANKDRQIIINYSGPPETVPHVSLAKFLAAAKKGDEAQLEKWVKGKVVLLGAYDINDRHDTPFYTVFAGTKFQSPGVEVHANTLNTLLTGNYLQPVPDWVRILGLLLAAGISVTIAVVFEPRQTVTWSIVSLLAGLGVTHLMFREGWLLSTSEVATAYLIAVIGGVVYRFATAERKSSFFRGAVALFVGKQVASSLEQSGHIGLTGKRQVVTILFTDIRGFTAFCESKDPAVVVDLLNTYMTVMVKIIVQYGGHVNKFIGDGILAVFSDDDEGAQAGDHAYRAIACAAEMVREKVGDFKTGAGIHSGEVVIGNVGSSDKMEFTVLGDTVNLASRLESLNKEQKTKMLLSQEALEMSGGRIDTVYVGEVPVRGKTEPMKLYTVKSLAEVAAA
ncbi:MAG TPA: adenylate/guanylate cyclase domain-containing protein [Bryobacteraceae bacterium]|nr:adenylate/guanylate cyclase domain-containing protein [Bryobacteraceae bacterium]